MGVKPLEFSIGFGPLLAQKIRRGMKISLRLILFGGFVRLKGLDEEEGKEDPDSYFVQPARKKMGILFAGPIANLILALMFFYLVPVFFGATRYLTVITNILPGSPAEKAGIPEHSIILSVNDKPANISFIRSQIRKSKGAEVHLLLRTAQGDQSYTIKPEWMFLGDGMGWGLGVHMREIVHSDNIVNWVKPGSSVWLAGLRPGDKIVSLNDLAVEVFFAQSIAEIQDDAQLQPKIIQMKWLDRKQNFYSASVTWQERSFHLRLKKKRVSPIAGFSHMWNLAALVTGQIGGFFIGLFRGQKEVLKQVAGPVGIFAYTMIAYQMGWDILFLHFAILSWVLGIMNLLPIPPLDGGRIAMLPLETLQKKNWNIWLERSLQLIGMVFLILLILWITVQDILKFRTGGFIP